MCLDHKRLLEHRTYAPVAAWWQATRGFGGGTVIMRSSWQRLIALGRMQCTCPQMHHQQRGDHSGHSSMVRTQAEDVLRYRKLLCRLIMSIGQRSGMLVVRMRSLRNIG